MGVDWPEQSERFARLRESVQLIQALRRRAPSSSTSRASTTGPTTRRSTTSRTSPCRSTSRPRGRPPPGSPGGIARRLHLHQRQGRGAVHRHAPAGAGRGGGEGRPRRVRDGPDDRDEGLLRHRPRPGDGGHQGLGGPRAHRRAEDGHPRPARHGGGGEGGRAVRAPALAGRGRPRRARRADRARTSGTGSTTSCSTSRARTRRRRSPATARSSCRACGRGSAHDGHRIASRRPRSCSTRSGGWPSRPAPRRMRSPSACGSWPGRPSARSRSRSRSGAAPAWCSARRGPARTPTTTSISPASGGSWSTSATRASTSGCATWPPAPPSPRRRHSQFPEYAPQRRRLPADRRGHGSGRRRPGLGPAAGAGPRPGRRGPRGVPGRPDLLRAGPAGEPRARPPGLSGPRPAPRPPADVHAAPRCGSGSAAPPPRCSRSRSRR